VNVRALVGVVFVALLVGASAFALVAVVPDLGSPQEAFINPGDRTPSPREASLGVVSNTTRDLPDGYVMVTFKFRCVEDWCDVPMTESLRFRLQNVNKSGFRLDGLHSARIRGGDQLTVGLEAYEEVRLLVERPDGIIVTVGTYTPTERGAVVIVRIRDDDTFTS